MQEEVKSRQLSWLAQRVFSLMVVALAVIMMLPAQAFAMEVTQCTARPNNSNASNEVIGAKETRVTWQANLAEDQVTQLRLTLPAGTTFDADASRVTLLTGDDLMTRVNTNETMTADGDTLVIDFPEPVSGGALRVEIYNVVFPLSGGEMQLSGTYTLVDDSTQEITGVPTIAVAGNSVFDVAAQYLEEQPWVEAWNSVKFLKLFFNPVVMVTSFPVVFQGFLAAIAIVAVAFPLAIPVGLVLALMRMSKFRVLRGIATTYVNIVRGTPLFLQIYIAFFGLPLADIHIPPFPLGVLVLSMNSAAYLCEIFRAGIQSISKGQFEASRSLGMNGAQTMLFVIIPQTVRRVIPTMTSEFILLYKDTSMLAAVGVAEVVMLSKTIVASTGSITPYIVAAMFYLVITLPLAKLVGKLENHLAGIAKPRKGKHGKVLTAEEAIKAGTWSHESEDHDDQPLEPENRDDQPVAGTDSAGVTAFYTDALTFQPVLKNEQKEKHGTFGPKEASQTANEKGAHHE